MQSWDANQNGTSSDGQANWSTGYTFPSQVGQFDSSGQDWTQQMQGQDAYNATSTPDSAFYSSNTPHGNGVLDGTLNGVSVDQTGFPNQGGLQQFQANPNALGASFNSIQSNVFNQQGRIDLGAGFGDDLNQGQNHQSRLHQAQNQAFSQQTYPSYPPRSEQQFQPSTAYSQQPIRQHAHQANVQQTLDSLQQHNYQGHPSFAQQAQQPQQQQTISHSQSFDQNAAPYPQPGQQEIFSTTSNNPFLQTQQQYQQAYSQAVAFAKPQISAVPSGQQHLQAPATSQPLSLSPGPNPTSRSITPQGIKRTVEQAPISQPSPDSSDAVSTAEPASKKRKKSVKKGQEIEFDVIGSPVPMKKAEEVESLPKPTSTGEELAEVAKFKKRPAAARAKLPAISGAGFLVSSGTIKLDAQKSHDKLTPLVAMPSQSGRRILPELGRDLACEIQGKFSAQFKPSATGGGLDDRKREAKELLEDFDQSMLDLGKKRPKYSEYPHAFKEQLKADESARKKTADKQARKMAEEERNKPVRAETRPVDPVEGAAWDIIGIVHIDSSANRTTPLLAGAVQQAGEYFMSLRGDMNRAKQEVDQAVKEKRDDELPELRKEADVKKEVLCRALETANKVGDEAVLENLGGHVKLVINLVNLLITCIKANDFSGKLPKATLGLIANFRMTQKVLTQANFETVRRRFLDKGDAEVKELLETIKSRIRKDAEVDGSPKKQTAMAGVIPKARAVSKMPSEAASTKRSRDDDTDSRAVKKQAVEAPGPAPQLSTTSKAGAATTQAKTVASKPRPAAGILPGKSRPMAKPVPKPDSSKTDTTKSESAKPSMADKLAVKTEPKKPVPRPETKSDNTKQAPKPAPTPSSSIGGGIASLLDSINAPKPEIRPVTDSDSDGIQETAEEKKKRLRKEARRKLRVSWKADAELEQVKYFQKEAEEEGGFESNSIKDAGDDKSEGMVLKQGPIADDDDEDEDDIPYRPWIEPTPASFSHIPADFRKQTYTTTGGDIVVDTEEQKRIAEREQKVLIAIYTNVAEIPPSPKSPPPESNGGFTNSKIGHLPRDDPRFEEVQRRLKETQQFGRDAALHYAMKRADARSDPAQKVSSILDTLKFASAPGSGSVPGPSISLPPAINPLDPRPTVTSGVPAPEKVLALLVSDMVRQWSTMEPWNPSMAKTQRRHDYPDPRVQSAIDMVEEIAARLFGKPYPPTDPPEWMQYNAEAVREWWVGYHKDAAARARKEADDRARAEAEAEAAQLAAAQAQAQAVAQAQAQAQANPNQTPQDAWAAYYAQQAYAPYMAMLQQIQQGGQPPAVAPPTTGASNDQLQALLAALSQGQPQTQPQAQAQTQAQAQAQAPPLANYMHPNDPSYQQLMMLSQMSQQQPSSDDYGPAASDGPGRDRGDRDRDHGSGRDKERGRDRDRDRDRGGKGRKVKGSGTLPPHRPANRALIGTKPCVFFKQGTCARGDQCTFRHD